MRLAESLTIPDELELARVSGKLVVFAGAGVSMGAPANLPGFRQLAREIAEPKIPWNENRYGEHLDFYLGDAERKGVKVQDRARAILSGRGGEHTSLHESLVGIFSHADQIRLITTNFDLHFSAAAAKVFPAGGIAHYIGPALPPGRDFAGVAHLHGSLSHTQDRLVLTDADFGAAYLADGWATRFLLGVFAQRTVLFTGYSLSDPVMQYLMRALPPTVASFALCHETERELWADRNVTPVTFADGRDGGRYSDLNSGLDRWRSYAQASPSDHNRELRRLISSGPPSSPEDADYIRARVKTESGRVTFLRAANTEPWFDWAASEGLLDALTDPNKDDPTMGPWGHWCLANFCAGAQPPLLRFLRRRSLTIHPWFATQLSHHLAAPSTLLDTAVRRQLIALLINTPASVATADHAHWLLRRLVKDGAAEESFAILRWMTRVRLQPIERYQISLEGDEPDETLPSLAFEIAISVSSELASLLETEGGAIAALGSEQLSAIGIQRIEEAYELLQLARGEGDSFDWISFRRTAIASTNQDVIAHAEDVLILIVRAALDYWKTVAPDRLLRFAQERSRDPRATLRRLALYAFANTTAVAGDDVIKRATREAWFADVLIRPELYLALRTHYAGASEAEKERLIDSLRDEASWGDKFDEHDARTRYGLSQLLRRLAPESAATNRFAADETKAHPDWTERDKDGLLSRVEVGWGGSEPSPIESSTMLEWTASEAVSHLASALRESAGREQTFALQGAIQQAATQNPTWGIDVFSSGVSDSSSDSLLESILWGLRSAECPPTEQRRLLEIVKTKPAPAGVANPLGSLIDKWSRELPNPSEPELLDAFDEVADILFQQSKSVGGALSEGRWVDRAINHPAGHAAQVWWSVANARDRVDDRFILTVDANELRRWERVLIDDTIAGALARPILGMVSDRLSAGDYPWAEKMLFPAFNPADDLDRASQLWDGRLLQHRWSWTTVKGLAPYIDNFLKQSASVVPERSSELGDVIAMFVANPEESKLDLRRLQTFVQFSTPEARRAFADRLPQHVGQLPSDKRRKIWVDAILPYWRDRRTNVPVPFDIDEIAEMTRWVEAFPEDSKAVLGELVATPSGVLPHVDSIIWEWKENDQWVRAHPDDAAGLLGFLASRRSLSSWDADDAVELLEIALKAGASITTVRNAAEEIVGTTSSQLAEALAERLK